jgi:trehalose synthase
MAKLDDYSQIVGQAVIDDLKTLAGKLKDKTVQHINSTAVGGGVAEILNRMIPLFNELGVESKWDVLKGGGQYYEVTKKFHNALHGKPENLTQNDFDIFMETSQRNIDDMNIYGDIVFVHDPQPIALVKKKSVNKWIWRCHIDVSNPERRIWDFLMGFVKDYDASVFSAKKFSQVLPIRQFLIAPSIDPLSDKNKELPQELINSVLEKYSIPKDKPIITQISRFDRLKDPLGVIESYKLVKKYIDCRLILAGGGASDDPEGVAVLEEVKDKARNDQDIHILLLPQDDLVVNALQRASDVILQKSLKEGFGLTIAEALWKGKPVVASNVGGIPLQITSRYSGLLTYSVEGTAFAIKQLLNHPRYAKMLGHNGREHVRNNFLLTRHLKEYMLLFLALYHDQDVVYL